MTELLPRQEETLDAPCDPLAVNKPARILVVDDESDLEILFRQIFRRELRSDQLAFNFVSNGQDALTLLEQDPCFDMILSDIRMPRMDGLTLLAHVNKRYPTIKVVMVTAYGDMENIRKAMNAGAFDFISKPIQYKDLKATIEKTLEHVSEIKELHRARREREQAQAQLVTELRNLDRLKDAFLANTSHELRTPLNGVIGLVESLIENDHEALPEQVDYKLRLVLQSARRLTFLVNDILDFSVMQENRLNLRLKPVSIRPIADLAIALTEAQTRSKNVLLINDIADDLPAVHADADRLQQIMLNLLSNAVKFTPSGAVTISAQREDDFLRIAVTDTGMGVPEDQRDAIFQAFYQSDQGAERMHAGTGLGLSIVKQLVDQHGGMVHLEAREGGGSIFSFTLPITADQPEASDFGSMPLLSLKDSPEPSSLSANPESSVNVSEDQFNILIVDDDPINLTVLREHLQQYRLQQTEDPHDALRRIIDAQPRFDLVILDVMMPGLSGYDICRRVREIYAPNELPILLLTARGQVNDLVTGLEAGANDFITKPITQRELQARVKSQLQLARMAAQLREAQAQGLKNARAAGRAVFATSVLHNVGNILSSIKVSCHQTGERLKQSKVTGLQMAGQMLFQQLENLPAFLTKDPKGIKLPEYLIKVSDVLKTENQALLEEVASMTKRLSLMENVIVAQQETARDKAEPLVLKDLVEESLVVQNDTLLDQGITVKRNYAFEGVVRVPHAPTIHILVNLIKNAIEAMADVSTPCLSIATGRLENGTIFCEVRDNGIGIENLNLLFKRGMTTKKFGHGFGLHYCFSTMQNLGGNLKAHSDGHGKGACFTMTFPNEMTSSS